MMGKGNGIIGNFLEHNVEKPKNEVGSLCIVKCDLVQSAYMQLCVHDLVKRGGGKGEGGMDKKRGGRRVNIGE